MAAPLNNFDFPHSPPPPPSHLIPPPPPHPIPPRPPSPSPDDHSAVIVFVFVSFGSLLLLALLVVALRWFFRRRKRKMVKETDNIHVDEHLKMKEAIVPGPHGPRAVVLSIEDDVHVDEVVRKNEEIVGGAHAKSADNQLHHEAVHVEGGAQPCSSSQHQLPQAPISSKF